MADDNARTHTRSGECVCVGCVLVSAGPGGRARRPIESNMAGCYIFFFFGGEDMRFLSCARTIPNLQIVDISNGRR